MKHLRPWLSPRRWASLVAMAVMTTALAACGGGAPPAEEAGGAPPQARARAQALPGAEATDRVATLATTLPIELLSDGSPLAPLVKEVTIEVAADELDQVAQLYFRCHRCGFFGAPEYEATSAPPVRIKASVRVLGGAKDANADAVPWVDVTDATVTLAEAERLQGGLDWGGFYTTHITLQLDKAAKRRLVAAPKSNRVQFRFNGTDGESNGYRVLDLALQDKRGRTLGEPQLARADIAAEKRALHTASDVDAGRVLWQATGRLWKSNLVHRQINAACASCHSSDGRDLQYFNYSNNAIVQRAKFHGLTDAEGHQIVAFLRDSLKSVPHVKQAAPWNPPYQPGEGLDDKPPVQWAAGAGLDAVLDTPEQAIKALLGQPVNKKPVKVSQREIDTLMDPAATHNVRETAIALQLPDWNAWLPTIHPVDVWPVSPPDATGSFQNGATFTGGGFVNPNGYAARIEAWLAAHKNPNGVYGDWSHLTPAEREDIRVQFRYFGWEGYHFIGGGRGNHIAPSGEYGAQVGARHLKAFASPVTTAGDPPSFTTNAFIERAVSSLLQWNVVRQWEWAQRYGLEGGQKSFLGTYDPVKNTWQGRGEKRGWPFNTVSAFFLAPHMLYQQDVDGSGRITREWIMAWEHGRTVGSYYRTNAWYQLQMTLNTGAQDIFSNYPMDWPYHTGFTTLLTKTLGRSTPELTRQGLTHTVRNLQVHAKMAQHVNNGFPLDAPNPDDPDNIWVNQGILGRAIALKHVQPSHDFLLDGSTDVVDQTAYRQLDTLAPGLWLQAVNGGIQQFNGLYKKTQADEWRRCDPNYISFGFSEPYAPFRFCLDQVLHPVPTDALGRPRMNGGGLNTTDQMLQYSVLKATEMGAEAKRLQVYSGWVDRMWEP